MTFPRVNGPEKDARDGVIGMRRETREKRTWLLQGIPRFLSDNEGCLETISIILHSEVALFIPKYELENIEIPGHTLHQC